MTTIDFVIGVDQTGAALRGGLAAKPLPCAFARREPAGGWSLRARDGSGRPLRLASFSPDAIELARTAAGWPGPLNARTLIAVDCVFGLAWTPDAAGGADYLWNLFDDAARPSDAPAYGRSPAEAFFRGLAARRGHSAEPPFPQRECEKAARANSVFQTRPYQKNVQCGTHRIWRDLGLAGKRWTRFVWFDGNPFAAATGERAAGATDDRPWTCEAFPTLAWREALGLRTRSPGKLRQAARDARLFQAEISADEADWRAIEADPDLADAAALAIAAAHWCDRPDAIAAPWIETARLRQEGWILGLRRNGKAEAPRQKHSAGT